MATSTANVNNTLEKISSAIHAAKRAGIHIGSDFHDDFFCCASMEGNLIRTIDLEDESASTLLNALLRDIYAITPSTQAMQGVA